MKERKFITLIIAIFIVFPAYYFTIRHFFPIAESGQFGDTFGALNALFSGLAFLGIIYTIFLQREELGLQRKELELTRKELTRAAAAQEKAEEALSKQAASLKVSAKLSGLSAILQHHNTLIEAANSARYGMDTVTFNLNKGNAEKIISEIKNLIESK